jgi:hypothetical protein
MVSAERQPRSVLGATACIAAILLSIAGWAGKPAHAGETETPAPDSSRPDFERLMEGKLERLFDHLEGVWQELPRYALPEVTEDGDIVIRRLPRPPERWLRTPLDPDEMVEL